MTCLATAFLAASLLPGCAAPTVDFSQMKRPDRAPELAAYDVFVGSWNWEAEAANAAESSKKWTGTAQWQWSLDQRCLRGEMSSKCPSADFQSTGIWSWHPTKQEYIWGMFNNWGYPQRGTATYDASAKTWRMDYASVGLDGTPSYGQYVMTVVDPDTLSWTMREWADMLRCIPKIEMRGTYKRAK
jgi:hypothetical protein